MINVAARCWWGFCESDNDDRSSLMLMTDVDIDDNDDAVVQGGLWV